MGESISEGTIAELLRKEGDAVEEDETIAQIETDKVTVDVKAPAAGKLTKLQVFLCSEIVQMSLFGEMLAWAVLIVFGFQVSVEDTVKVGQVVAIISEGAGG